MTDYHSDPAPAPSLSSSIAHVLLSRSPRHAWTAHPKLNPDHVREHSDAFDLGNVVHELLLEQRDPQEVCVVVPFTDWRTKTAQEQRDAARAEGRIPVLTSQWDRILEMTARVAEQLLEIDADPPLLDDGIAEMPILWEEDGIWLRAKPDWLRDDLAAIDDLKTTSRSASPSAYAKALYQNGGDLQAAFYRRAVNAYAEQENWHFHGPQFRWIVCETSPPYAVSAITPAADVLAIGEAKVDAAIELWRRHIVSTERDDWPAYPPVVHRVEAPAWEEARWLERADELELR